MIRLRQGRAWRRVAARAAAALVVIGLVPTVAPGSASAADGVEVDWVEIQQCDPSVPWNCDVPIWGVGLDAVTSVSTDPVRTLTIASQTPTELVVSFPTGQAKGVVDLVLHSPGGDVRVEAVLMFASSEGQFATTDPTRVLDTRWGSGAKPIPGGGTRVLDFSSSGIEGISGAGSLLLNVTVTQPTASGHLTLYPSDIARPTASNVNFRAGQDVPNLTSVKLSADRTVTIHNGSNGTAHVVVDVVGYHTRLYTDRKGRLMSVPPDRAYDSRADAPFGADGPELVELGPFPAGTVAVAMNVTAVGAARRGHVTIFPADEPTVPVASNLNVRDASPVANMVVVRTDSDGMVAVDTNIAGLHLVFDVVGVSVLSTNAPHLPSFTSTSPERVLDTRKGIGAPVAPLVGRSQLALDVDDIATVPADAEALLLNVTVTAPTAAGYLTVWPGGLARPLASSLNFSRGATVANAVLVPIGSDRTVRFYVPTGTAHVVADLAGYYSYS